MSDLAVLFDMDGLMIDSEPLQSKSYDKVLRAHGIEPELNSSGVIQTVGVNALDNWKMLHKKHSLSSTPEGLLKLKDKAYQEIIEGGMDPMPGLLELVKELKDQGVPMALASSSNKHDILKILTHLGVLDDFEVIVSGTEVKRGKPAPDIFLEAARQINIQPGHCLVLEDAQSGVEAAKAANMKVVAVPNQYTLTNDFSKADRVIASLQDLDLKSIRNLVFGS